jgi:hypothetical protein
MQPGRREHLPVPAEARSWPDCARSADALVRRAYHRGCISPPGRPEMKKLLLLVLLAAVGFAVYKMMNLEHDA